MDYRTWAAAALLDGFLAERRGEKEAVEAAWRRGTVEEWQAARDEKTFPSGTMERLLFVQLGALTGRLQQAHLDAIVASFSPRGSNDPKKAASPAELMLQAIAQQGGGQFAKELFDISSESLVALWSHERGRSASRDLAFQRVPLYEIVGGQARLLLNHSFGRFLGGKPTETQDKLLDTWTRDFFDDMRAGKITNTTIAQFGAAYIGMTGNMGWGGLARKLRPEVRGPAAYFLAFHLESRDKKDVAETLWKSAYKDGREGDPLRPLAAAELERLGVKPP